MKKAECLTKIREMLKDVRGSAIAKADHLLKSGAINLDSYENNYLLPKIILTVVLEDIAGAYAPLTRKSKADVRNLRHF